MTQQVKNILLIVCLLLLFVMAYQFGILKTVTLGNQIEDLKKKEQLYKSAPSQLNNLINKEEQLNSILKENNVSGISLQNDILKVLNDPITLFKDELNSDRLNYKLINFEIPHTYRNLENESLVTTYDFTLEGNYESLIKVIYKLEQEYSFGNLMHVYFLKKKNYRTGKERLQCSLMLQRIESNF